MDDRNALVMKLDQSGLLMDEDREQLRALCTSPREVAAGTALVQAGERPVGIHVVLDGFAYRYKIVAGGRRQIIGLLVPGDFCDLQSAIMHRCDHDIVTLTASTIVKVPQHTVDALTLAPSRIARALWWSTLLDESILRERLASIGQRRADERLAHFFCELLTRLEVVGRAGRNGCDVPFTQDKLADFLGLTPVHISRTVKELRLKNLLQFKNRQLTVLDRPRLETFCDFDPVYLHLMGKSPSSASAAA